MKRRIRRIRLALKRAGLYNAFHITLIAVLLEYLRNGVVGMIIKPNEARRKLDMEDAEGGDVLLANGSIVPLTMAGAAYLKGESEQENTDEPEQPEEETEPDTEQPDTATEPDETDTAEDETDEEGGE